MNAKAVSHLEEISDSEIELMAKSETVGILLPTTAMIIPLPRPPARKMPKRKAKKYISNNITNHNKRFSERLKNNKNVTTTDISSSNLQIDNQNTSSSSTTLQQISTSTSSLSQPISSPTLKFIFCNGCKKIYPIQKHTTLHSETFIEERYL